MIGRIERLAGGPWWKKLKLTPAMGAAVAVLVGGFFIVKQLRPTEVGTEGTLRVNLNTATLTELESIPGIGPSSVKGLEPYVKVEGETEKLR